ncbi:MAG: sensor histidine kinase [Chloroflexi bacterium]|nr:sensor histidine kinase [Chloroflexota bacterium]MBU1746694.1 sensor histidine kinase [Chloroflexota bacterium]MBU1880139.1 sensor histidine kinase [Chloroflexota bacterium]
MAVSPTGRRSLNVGQVLYGSLYVVLAVVYGSVILAGPRGREPVVLIPFTVLLFIIAALHLVLPQPEAPAWRRLLYVVIQGLLALACALITGGQGLVMILFFLPVGEAGYLFRKLPIMIVVTMGLGLTWVGAVYFTQGGVLPTDELVQGGIGFLFVGVYTMMFGRHEHERQRAEELLRELEVAHRQLQEYADQVETLTLNQERQRMARELHDTLAQGVAGLILQLEAIDSLLDQDKTTRAQGVVQQAMARARTTLADARRAIQALRAEPLGHGGLLDAIQDAVDDLAATGTLCTLEVSANNWDLAVPLAEHVLRIVQEGLTNTARHASAAHALVRLSRDESGVRVEIQDDGEGFDPAVVGQNGHFGLLGLRERAQAVGGTLEIESVPGHGTRLVAYLPLVTEGRDD